MKKFGVNPRFHNFHLNSDSLGMNLKNFKDFFNFRENKGDSVSSKSQQRSPLHSQSQSMNEMMKMLHQQMQQMEEYQRKFFKEEPKLKEF